MTQNVLFQKYRPQIFDDVLGNKEIIKEIESTVNTGKIPHMLFYGSPGVGKTTVAYVIKNKLTEIGVLDGFLEINASDDRGIETVRQKIKMYAKTKTADNTFKIIFLDEADSMLEDSQEALRMIMEQYSNNCIFLLSCNRIFKIIEPIQSRCVVYAFKPIEKEAGINQLKMINDKENGDVDNDYLESIFDQSGGDMRKCINILQSALSGNCRKLSEVFETDIYDRIINSIVAGNLRQPLVDLNKLTEDPRDIVQGLYNSVFEKDLKNSKEFYINLGELDRALSQGALPKIQFAWFISKLTM